MLANRKQEELAALMKKQRLDKQKQLSVQQVKQ